MPLLASGESPKGGDPQHLEDQGLTLQQLFLNSHLQFWMAYIWPLTLSNWEPERAKIAAKAPMGIFPLEWLAWLDSPQMAVVAQEKVPNDP